MDRRRCVVVVVMVVVLPVLLPLGQGQCPQRGQWCLALQQVVQAASRKQIPARQQAAAEQFTCRPGCSRSCRRTFCRGIRRGQHP
jgi:hypothetical protein